ncbi:MAG: undecaprenyldiphospho-muramoylpentapeptide beta-N-acetylglucosaminyltransferase [Longimonas sp.]|uniref:undecaprenyldiphospho-muramoylpentapeptide beta-N-acetylglucosaminyltransferase n=1 Tax=Longimonas sp. TaxID=2039626 RepID=UPI0039762873
MNPRPPHILIAGGGTGGHVYPAIAIADAIRDVHPDAVVVFAGTRDRLEARAVPQAGYALHPITVSGFQRAWTWDNLSFPVKLIRGLVQSWRLTGAIDPDVVVGTGGYVAGPVGMAAWLRGIPLVMQEQNAYVGVTNRLLSPLAASRHVAFPEAQSALPDEGTHLSGNPIRPALLQADAEAARTRHALSATDTVLLVTGGSLGSAALNEALRTHYQALLEAYPDVHIWWQTGTRYYEALDRTLTAHPRLRLMEYIDRMDEAYAVADLALCRAGALTCSELLATATPAVLVPSPNVVEDHQTKNARSLSEVGAAVLLPEDELTTDLRDTLHPLLNDAARRAAMATAAHDHARPDAARTIARDVLRLATARS